MARRIFVFPSSESPIYTMRGAPDARLLERGDTAIQTLVDDHGDVVVDDEHFSDILWTAFRRGLRVSEAELAISESIVQAVLTEATEYEEVSENSVFTFNGAPIWESGSDPTASD